MVTVDQTVRSRAKLVAQQSRQRTKQATKTLFPLKAPSSEKLLVQVIRVPVLTRMIQTLEKEVKQLKAFRTKQRKLNFAFLIRNPPFTKLEIFTGQAGSAILQRRLHKRTFRKQLGM